MKCGFIEFYNEIPVIGKGEASANDIHAINPPHLADASPQHKAHEKRKEMVS